MDACREVRSMPSEWKMLVRACDGNGTCRVQLRLYFAVEIENDCSLFARDSHVLSSFYSCWVDHGNYLSPEEKMRKIPAKLVTMCIGR